MGVQGLTTVVEGNRDLLKDVKFRDSRLVIDGCSLYFWLYFKQGLDQQHGGDYDAFADLLTQFLSALAACNIQPYVVIDGGIDPSDKKFSTVRERLKSKIREADSIAHGRNGSVLPILTRDVFIQSLIQKGVPLVQCPAEADWEIACLAHQWNCPVLSNDSDFYIFYLPGGYLPLRFFQWTNLNGKASNRYIPARSYTTNGLCGLFGIARWEFLPLCAVLIGNDYGAPKDADKVFAMLDTCMGGGGRNTSRIEHLFLWLSSFTKLPDALEEVIGMMGEEGGKGKRGQKGGLSSHLWAAMHEYYITPQSSLAHWFSGGRTAPGEQTFALMQLPECLLQAAARGLLAPLVVDAVVMHRILLMPQVENSKLASSHCSARAIRQAIYGILLQREAHDVRVQGNISLDVRGMRGGRGQRGRGRAGSQGYRGWEQGSLFSTHVGFNGEQAASATPIQAQGSSAAICVEEYDRLDLNLKKNQVEAHSPRTPVPLHAIEQAPVAVRLGALLEVLGVKESALASVTPHLKLAVAVTGFWLREAVPTPSQLHLQALLLGMVYGELSWNNQPEATQLYHAVPCCPNLAAEHNVWAGLDRQRVRHGERRGLDVGVAHSFSQWQACLWSALCLNHLLLLPLPEPHLSWLFSGTLVHGLFRYLKGGRSAESLLPMGSLSGKLYSTLLDAVRKCSSKADPSSSAAGRRKRGRGRGRRGRGGGGRGAWGGWQGVEEIDNRFALLMNEEGYDEYWQ
ncbi:protein asteroid homolog 1 [Mastacembelus armatus]|uniref:Asteroid domain-containing protein n=1 Tax=Mastacembelus armatus TaxID=205130 RepID=A0A3Q3LR34_9TELE|nr:protein asteroid homolog 1-like [Mastacembelus armatus]